MSIVLLLFLQSPFLTHIEFSGMKWGVFTNYDPLSKNQFTKKGIFVDSLGYLHLKAWKGKRDTGFVYYASGIISQDRHLYGVYRFETFGRLDNFIHTNFSPFLYDWDKGVYEIDIEYYRKKKKDNPGNFNLHFMPHGKHYKKHYDFKLPDDSIHAIHYIYLFPDSIVLKTDMVKDSVQKTLGYWVVRDKRFIPTRPVYMEVYLWWNVRSKKGEKKREIILKSVKYTPFLGETR